MDIAIHMTPFQGGPATRLLNKNIEKTRRRLELLNAFQGMSYNKNSKGELWSEYFQNMKRNVY